MKPHYLPLLLLTACQRPAPPAPTVETWKLDGGAYLVIADYPDGTSRRLFTDRAADTVAMRRTLTAYRPN